LLVRRVFFLLNAAFAIAILALSSVTIDNTAAPHTEDFHFCYYYRKLVATITRLVGLREQYCIHSDKMRNEQDGALDTLAATKSGEEPECAAQQGGRHN
jgi:hypothetical protein